MGLPFARFALEAKNIAERQPHVYFKVLADEHPRPPGRTIEREVEVEVEVMMQFDRITINPNRMNGQPCIRNLRLTVRRVLEILALYPDRAELRQEYPELEEKDIQQALAYAAASLEDRIIELPDEVAT